MQAASAEATTRENDTNLVLHDDQREPVVRIMPRLLLLVTLTFAFTACTPTAFGWQEGLPRELIAYRQSFEDAAGSELLDSITRRDLLAQMERSKLLWLGDHHRHSRLHALQTELLEQLQQRGVQMAFGLEAIGVRDERLVNDFLANRIDLNTLREQVRTRWDGSWLDDRDLDPWFYRSLLEFAKRHRIPVFALEPTPRLELKMRDTYIAQTIQNACERYQDKLIVVLLGQTHLLGKGDVVGRSGRRGTVLGGLPTERLLSQSPSVLARGDFWRTDQNVYWFGEMFRGN